MDEHLLLTDDEVLAIAVRGGSAWPGGIPTVVGSAEAVAQAEFRGRRSLFVRGLSFEGDESHRATEPLDAAGSLVASVLQATGRIAAYLGDDDHRRAGWGLASTIHTGPDRWLLETVDPLGIHRLQAQSVDELRAYVAALLRSATVSGPVDPSRDGVPGAKWMCALAEGGGAEVMAAARLGELLLGGVEIDDEQPRFGVAAPATVESAVERLFQVAAAVDAG